MGVATTSGNVEVAPYGVSIPMSARNVAQFNWPTRAELNILQVLWKGPSTVREIHQALYGNNGPGYTAALKLMQNMLAKGLVKRDEVKRKRADVYHAAIEKVCAQTSYISDILDRLFDGSASELVLHTLSNHTGASLGELGRIRDALSEMKIEARPAKRAARPLGRRPRWISARCT